jgi:hypothetical protein
MFLVIFKILTQRNFFFRKNYQSQVYLKTHSITLPLIFINTLYNLFFFIYIFFFKMIKVVIFCLIYQCNSSSLADWDLTPLTRFECHFYYYWWYFFFFFLSLLCFISKTFYIYDRPFYEFKYNFRKVW